MKILIFAIEFFQIMIRLIFNKFRSWDNLTLEIPSGSVTLIKGNSGSGKTTIFQGISWCLYGNIRMIAPINDEKAKTKVTIELQYNLNGVTDNLCITRQKSPNRLLVSHGNSVYEDKVAQEIINDIFGVYDIWLASCYLGQGCRNTFLTSPNTGKMEILNSIAFHEEDPSKYIEKIDSAITEHEYISKSKLETFTQDVNAFESKMSSVDFTKALTPQQVVSIEQEISDISQEITRLQTVKLQRDVDVALLARLNSQLDQLNNSLFEIPKPDPILVTSNSKYLLNPIDSLNNIDSNIDVVTGMLPLVQQANDLLIQISKLDPQLLQYKNYDVTKLYSENDYLDSLSKETLFIENQRLAQTLGVPYTDHDVSSAIEYNQSILDAQDLLKLLHQRDNLRDEISALEIKYHELTQPLVFPDVSPKEIIPPDYSKYDTHLLSLQLNNLSQKQGAAQENIKHLQNCHDVIQCPQCKCSLRYQHQKLSVADSDPVNHDDLILAQNDLRSINSEISQLTKTIQAMTSQKAAEKASYENLVFLEQKRLDSLRSKIRSLELEQQRRDISKQSQYKLLQDLNSSLDVLNIKIDSFGPLDLSTKIIRILSPKEINDTHSLIARLKTINFVPRPLVSSHHIRSSINHHNLLIQKTKLTESYNSILIDIPKQFTSVSLLSLQSYLSSLKIYRDKFKHSIDQKFQSDNLKTSLQSQIIDISSNLSPDPAPIIYDLNSKIYSLQQSLDLNIKAQNLLAWHQQISSQRTELLDINTSLSDLRSFRQHAVFTECRILQEVVESINNNIDAVCTTLFDRDINITLNLFKTIKTTKNLKPFANFSISYQGGVFDNINLMSGGEGDRASLALTLALNRLSSCPLLMFDESLSSLDITMKDSAIRAIRENTTNTVLIIMHDGIEGIFDHVIDIDQFHL